MQVANALNNVIRILFNPRVENFKLFDFLMVKSQQDKYLAQIIEIYDDKFDASQNVAKIKLFYKISDNNEVIPYDNFTPNKECEIIKLKQEEIEKFINQDDETFIFGTNVKTQKSLHLKYNIFDNSPVILADKLENACAINVNLAKNLSEKRNVVVIDSTGAVEFDNAKKIKASKDFRMPLNYSTIDFIFENCLSKGSLEFQTVSGQIINEIKKFAKAQKNNFIPFNAFTRVVLQQYKATPYPDLKLLLVELKKLQMNEIFARTIKDKENLFKTISNNKITIIDLSEIDSHWQKAYLEYIVDELEDEVYFVARINDENCDLNLINKIYNKKKNIKFIPNVSYSYKKLPSILQYCNNYLLLPSLYQRNDFLDANFALSNIIVDGCIIFGKNTDNFLCYAKDYELKAQEERKNYKKIALSLIQEDEEKIDVLGQDGDYFENEQKNLKEKTESEKLLEGLSQNTEAEPEVIDATEEFSEVEEVQNSQESDNQEEFEEIEQPFSSKAEILEEVKEPTVEEKITNFDDEIQIDNNKEKSSDEFAELDKTFKNIINDGENDDMETKKPEIENSTESKETDKEEKLIYPEIYDNNKDTVKEENEEKTTQEINVEDKKEETTHQDTEVLSDEELDFFDTLENLAQKSEEEQEQYDTADTEEEVQAQKAVQETETEEVINLEEMANNSLDNSFKEIINEKSVNEIPTIEIDEDVKINIDEIKINEESDLPIFKEEGSSEDETDKKEFKIGDRVIHKVYGSGQVTKAMNQNDGQLLQIEFESENIGKKVLDPKIAGIELEQ